MDLGSRGLVRLSAASLSAPFSGFIDYCALRSEGNYFTCDPQLTHAVCQSTHHRLVLTKR